MVDNKCALLMDPKIYQYNYIYWQHRVRRNCKYNSEQYKKDEKGGNTAKSCIKTRSGIKEGNREEKTLWFYRLYRSKMKQKDYTGGEMSSIWFRAQTNCSWLVDRQRKQIVKRCPVCKENEVVDQFSSWLESFRKRIYVYCKDHKWKIA